MQKDTTKMYGWGWEGRERVRDREGIWYNMCVLLIFYFILWVAASMPMYHMHVVSLEAITGCQIS